MKTDILAALLLQAQDTGRELTARERAWATTMIESSDNDAATALWEVIGGAPGLDAANERLGLTGTTAATGDDWGLTQTTAADQVELLRAVFTARPGPRTGRGTGAGTRTSPVLDAGSRAYVRELMGRVVAGQDWGVSAAGPAVGLKNGWMPRTATGLWVIDTIGTVTADGRRYLVAVLSSGNATKDAGIALVEAAARAAVMAAAAF